MSAAETKRFVCYVRGTWYCRPPWHELDKSDVRQLLDASIRHHHSHGSEPFVSLFELYQSGDPVASDVPQLIVASVNEQVPGSGDALMLLRSRVGKPSFEEIDVRTIYESDNIRLIASCIVAFGMEGVETDLSLYQQLEHRDDIPEGMKHELRELIAEAERKRDVE